MTHADFLRKLGDSSKTWMTVEQYERLYQIALVVEAGETDAAIVRAVIESRGVSLTAKPNSTDGYPEWTARWEGRVGYSHDANGTNLARNALIGFSQSPK